MLMSDKPKIYDNRPSIELSIDNLANIYHRLGVTRIFYKSLSPNDNSKNQPYMAGHLTELGFLPTGEVTESISTSRKTKDPKRKIKYSIKLDYFWIFPKDTKVSYTTQCKAYARPLNTCGEVSVK